MVTYCAYVQCFQEYVRQSGKEPFDPESHGGYWRQLTVRTSCEGHVMAIVVIHPQGLTEVTPRVQLFFSGVTGFLETRALSKHCYFCFLGGRNGQVFFYKF